MFRVNILLHICTWYYNELWNKRHIIYGLWEISFKKPKHYKCYSNIFIVVEILLVRLRVAKSLKNFRLQRMNQISLITHSVERSWKCSLLNSKMLTRKYRTGRKLLSFKTHIKQVSCHKNDALMFGCILSFPGPWHFRWDSKMPPYLHFWILPCGECAPPVAFWHLSQHGILPSSSHILLLSNFLHYTRNRWSPGYASAWTAFPNFKNLEKLCALIWPLKKQSFQPWWVARERGSDGQWRAKGLKTAIQQWQK